MNGHIYVPSVIVIKVYTMDKKLRERIDDWNKIKYPNNKETRIIIATLKSETKGTVTTAPNIKE